MDMLGGSPTGWLAPPRGCYSLHTLVCTLTSPIYPIVQKSLYQKYKKYALVYRHCALARTILKYVLGCAMHMDVVCTEIGIMSNV